MIIQAGVELAPLPWQGKCAAVTLVRTSNYTILIDKFYWSTDQVRFLGQEKQVR